MKRYSGFSMVAVAALLLQGCLGSGGSSAPAPNNVKVVAKDSRVVVTWDMVGGVQYWMFKAVGTGITPENCSTMSSCTSVLGAVSPTTLWGLSNGATYSFTINGRKDGGPGGPGSAAVEATPRPAGAAWTTGTAPTANNLNGVAYGTKFVSVGNNGAIFSSTDGSTWTAATTNPASGPAIILSAVNYDAALAKYMVAGSGGAILVSSDAATWSLLTSGAGGTTKTGNALYAVANNGANTYVATGAAGTIITSLDGGVSWTAQTYPGSPALNGVTYGYSTASSTSYYFVAVGASGTILYSADGSNWASSSPGGANLTGVTYGNGVFIAVGASGTVWTSSDGKIWAPRTSISAVSTATINAVTYFPGRRFIAVAADGNIYYNEYSNAGVDWTPVTPKATTSSLNAVTTGGLYDYSAVGASGLNLYAD